MSDTNWIPKIGNGATIQHYSDATACTIVKISASGKTVWLQEDVSTLDNWKPEILPGGFAGHCINNFEQKYTYKPNPNGAIHRASFRKNGQLRTTNNERVTEGRRHFHDYNF
jgi:hypothetical protein